MWVARDWTLSCIRRLEVHDPAPELVDYQRLVSPVGKTMAVRFMPRWLLWQVRPNYP
jgi:hypothetical protein